MPAISAAATHRALSAGALLALGSGLALYQLTSLVIGPAGGRALHLSLTIGAGDVDEPSIAPAERANLVLGTLAAPPAASNRAARRPAARPTVVPGPTPPPAFASSAPVTPVESTPPTTHHSDKPKPRHDD